jgi:hypothetical protein
VDRQAEDRGCHRRADKRAIGGRTIDHGGAAIVGGFDAMIRLRSFEMTNL